MFWKHNRIRKAPEISNRLEIDTPLRCNWCRNYPETQACNFNCFLGLSFEAAFEEEDSTDDAKSRPEDCMDATDSLNPAFFNDFFGGLGASSSEGGRELMSRALVSKERAEPELGSNER